MLPTLRPSQLVLGTALITPRPGHLVAIKRDLLSVKRVAHINDEGTWVEGDNSGQSTDSRTYGYVDPSQIEAVVFMILPLR